MKIPPGYNGFELDDLKKVFIRTARKLTMKHGIIISAMHEFKTETKVVIRLYFKIDGCESEFDSLNDLKKALKNKAFI